MHPYTKKFVEIVSPRLAASSGTTNLGNASLLSRLARPLLRPLRKPLRTATTAGPRTTNGTQQLRNPSKEQMQATSSPICGARLLAAVGNVHDETRNYSRTVR